MKFYEAMVEVKGTNKMFVWVEGTGRYICVYKFAKDGVGLLRSDLKFAMVDKYWLPVYFYNSNVFSKCVCERDYVILNSFEDLYKFYLGHGGEFNYALERLKLARRYGVINKEQEKKMLEVLNDYRE